LCYNMNMKTFFVLVVLALLISFFWIKLRYRENSVMVDPPVYTEFETKVVPVVETEKMEYEDYEDYGNPSASDKL